MFSRLMQQIMIENFTIKGNGNCRNEGRGGLFVTYQRTKVGRLVGGLGIGSNDRVRAAAQFSSPSAKCLVKLDSRLDLPRALSQSIIVLLL